MSSCLPCFTPPQPKYDQHIQSLYPTVQSPAYKQSNYQSLEDYAAHTPDGQKPKNVNDICRYAQMYPNKLPKIGQALQQRTQKHIRKNRPTLACVGMYTMLQLIESCHTDDVITLYDESILAMIHTVLIEQKGQTTVQQKQLAFELIVRLMHVQDDGTDFYKYEGLWSYVIHYLSDTTASANDAAKLRYSCIRACTALCQHFDTHRASTHYGAVIPLLLNNLHSSTSIVALSNIPMDPAWLDSTSIDTVTSVQPSVTELSTYTLWCYYTIVQTTTLSDVESILRPLLRWLDEHRWSDPDMNVQLFLAIANNKQLPYLDLVVLRLVRHIDYVQHTNNASQRPSRSSPMNNNSNSPANTRKPASSIEMQSVSTYTPAVKSTIVTAVATTIDTIIQRATVKVNNYQSVLDNILSSLVRVPDASTNDAEGNTGAYSTQLSHAVVSMVSQLKSPQAAVNILQIVLQRYCSYVSRSASLTDHSHLLQLASQLSQMRLCNLNGSPANDKMVTTIVTASLRSTDVTSRNAVINVLLNILSPQAKSVEDKVDIDNVLTLIIGKQLPPQSKHSYIMSTADQSWLLSLVYHEMICSIQSPPSPNSPDAHTHITDAGRGESSGQLVQSVWRLMILLLLQNPVQRLQQHYPLLDKLYTLASDSTKLSALLSARIHIFLFAYAAFASAMFEETKNNSTAKQLDDAMVALYEREEQSGTVQRCDVTMHGQLGLIATPSTSTGSRHTYQLDDQTIQLLARMADAQSSTSFEPADFKYLTPDVHNTADLSVSWAPSYIVLQRSASVVLDDNDINASPVNTNGIPEETGAPTTGGDVNIEPISDTQAAIEARGALTQQPSTSVLNGIDEEAVPTAEQQRSVDEILAVNGEYDDEPVKSNDINVEEQDDSEYEAASARLSAKLTDLYNAKWNQSYSKPISPL